MVLPSVPSAPTLWGWKAPGAPRRPETAPGQRSPPVALFLQQAPQGLQVPHVGGVVQPRVLAVLQRVVTELLPQPLLQIRTCTEERGACQLRAALPGHQQGAPPTQERVSLQSAPLVAAHGLQPTRLPCPQNAVGKSTGVVLPLPSPRDFSDPGTEPTSQHCRQFLYCLSHQGSPSHREGALQLNSTSFPCLQKLPEPERRRKSPRIKLACAQHQTRQEYNV